MIIQTEYNAGYYTAELDEPPWRPEMNFWGQDWYPNIDTWCEEVFGKGDLWGEEPVTGWKRMRNKYFFTDEKKLNWFVMRWQ